MRIFKDNFKPELFRRVFFNRKPKKQGKYEVAIINTPNGTYKYSVRVKLVKTGKDITDDYYHYRADTKLGALSAARKIIKEYEKSLRKDKVIHRTYL